MNDDLLPRTTGAFVSGLALKSRQQESYEQAYADANSHYGMPDGKIGTHLVGKRILTVGCGTANDLWHLARDNDVVGVDYAGSAADIAERHGVRMLSQDLNQQSSLPFPDRSFDVVVCKDILEHLLEPLLVLKELRRIVKDDGYAVVSVPNHFALPMRLRILLGRGILYRSLFEDHTKEYAEWNYMHVRFFTYQGFRNFLSSAGWQPKKWFWDFGNLAHYHDPEMWLEPQLEKRRRGMRVSTRGKIGLYLLRPAWRAFNVVFPRSFRSAIVALSPGLLCGGFYVHCVKTMQPDLSQIQHSDIRLF